MNSRSRRRPTAALALTAIFSLSTMGCNLFGQLDNPGTVQDTYDIAVSLANAGDCTGAANLLKTIQNPNDQVFVALGWAQLCQAGATATLVAQTLYKFTGSSTDYTPVGQLARNLLPMTSAALKNISDAINSFGQINDGQQRGLQRGIAYLVQASAILATEAGNDGNSTLIQTDISQASCAADPSCATFVNCINAGTMSDSDAASFASAATSAANDFSSTGAGDLSTLAAAIEAGAGAGSNATRCFVFNQVIPNP